MVGIAAREKSEILEKLHGAQLSTGRILEVERTEFFLPVEEMSKICRAAIEPRENADEIRRAAMIGDGRKLRISRMEREEENFDEFSSGQAQSQVARVSPAPYAGVAAADAAPSAPKAPLAQSSFSPSSSQDKKDVRPRWKPRGGRGRGQPAPPPSEKARQSGNDFQGEQVQWGGNPTFSGKGYQGFRDAQRSWGWNPATGRGNLNQNSESRTPLTGGAPSSSFAHGKGQQSQQNRREEQHFGEGGVKGTKGGAKGSKHSSSQRQQGYGGGVPKVGTNDAARVRGGWGVRTWRRQTPQGMRGFQVFFTKELATYPPFSTYTKVQ